MKNTFSSGTTTRSRVAGILTILSSLALWGGWVDKALASNAEDGGSGLVRVDYAWSMPFRGLLVSTHAGYFSSEGAPGSARFMTLTPSLTKGLSNGLEGAVALPFELLTSSLDGPDFDRRFDVRQRGVLGKLRWSGPLAGPRLRAGVQALVAAPFFESSTRPGGDRTPSRKYDGGVMGLLSANVGGFSFPLRIHANLGYWWSRDDGAVYLRQLPGALPLAADAIEHNDLLLGGLAIEAGLPRFVLFAELSTEQLVGARAQVRGRENLWRITPGVRTAVGQNISLTAGMSFDLSADDGRTAFNPKDAYPDVEFRVGLLLGTVLTRQRYEASRRQRDQVEWVMEGREIKQADGDQVAAPLPAVVAVPEEMPAASPAAPPAPTAGSPAPTVTPPAHADLRVLEERLARIEMQLRMTQIEARLRDLERHGVTPAATPADTAAGSYDPLTGRLSAMQQQIDALARAPVVTPPAGSSPTAASGTAPASPSRALPAATSRPAAPAIVVTPPAASTQAPAASVAPVAVPPRDPETERLWAEIDSLADELLEDRQAAAAFEPTVTAGDSLAPGVLEPPVTPEPPSFPLAPGERAVVTDVDLMVRDPLAVPATRKVLEEWAALLAAYPEVQVVLLVHVGGDRAESLDRSTELAERLRDYVVIAGADAGSVSALGMGASELLAEPGDPGAEVIGAKLEIERLR